MAPCHFLSNSFVFWALFNGLFNWECLYGTIIICSVITNGLTFLEKEGKSDWLSYQFDYLPDKNNMNRICLKFLGDLSSPLMKDTWFMGCILSYYIWNIYRIGQIVQYINFSQVSCAGIFTWKETSYVHSVSLRIPLKNNISI